MGSEVLLHDLEIVLLSQPPCEPHAFLKQPSQGGSDHGELENKRPVIIDKPQKSLNAFTLQRGCQSLQGFGLLLIHGNILGEIQWPKKVNGSLSKLAFFVLREKMVLSHAL